MLLSALLLLSPAMADDQDFIAVSGPGTNTITCTLGSGSLSATMVQEYEVVMTQTIIDGMQNTGVGGVFVSWDPDYNLDTIFGSPTPTNELSVLIEVELERTTPVLEGSWSFHDDNGDFGLTTVSMGMPLFFLRNRTIQNAQVGDIIRLAMHSTVAVNCNGTGNGQSRAWANPTDSVPVLVW